MFSCIRAVALCLCLCALVQQSRAYLVHVYWGQNKASAWTQDTSLYEPSLQTFCSNRAAFPYDVITISFMTKHYMSTSDPVPGLQLTNHCSMAASGHAKPSPPGAPAFLNCPAMTSQIQYCQSLGIKVLLGLSPTDSLADDNDGAKSATNIWNYFLGGSNAQRPFGSAVLDGVDFFIRSGGVNGYVGLVTKLNSYFQSAGRSYLLVASPLAATGNAYYGPLGNNTLMLANTNTACMFSYLNLFMMTIPQHYINTQLFYQQIQYWYNWINGLSCSGVKPNYLVGLPSHDGWVDDAPGDYIPPWTLQNQSVVQNLRSASPLFNGIALYEASMDKDDPPCAGSTKAYSSWVSDQLTGPINAIGLNTPNASRCTGPPSNQATRNPSYIQKSCVGDACFNGGATSLSVFMALLMTALGGAAISFSH